MTAEEFLKEHGIPNMPTQYSLQFQTDVKDTVKALEAYANQKVLEALEDEQKELNRQLTKVIKEHPLNVDSDTYWRGVKIGLETCINRLKNKLKNYKK